MIIDVFTSLMVNRSKYCRSKFKKFDAMQFYCPEDFFLFFSYRQMLRIRILVLASAHCVLLRSVQTKKTWQLSLCTLFILRLFFFFSPFFF